MSILKLLTSSLIISVLLFGKLEAQTDQGKFLLTGSSSMDLSFSSSETTYEADDGDSETSDGPSTTGFGFSPKAGIFIVDGLAVGADIQFNTLTEKDEEEEWTMQGVETVQTKSTRTNWTFGPFARYYLDFGLFGELGTGFGTSSSSYYVDGEETESSKDSDASSIFRWNVGAGYAMFLGEGKRVALEPMLMYSRRTLTDDQEDGTIKNKNGSFDVNLSISVFL